MNDDKKTTSTGDMAGKPSGSTATPNRDKPRDAPVIDGKPGDVKETSVSGAKPNEARPQPKAVGPIAALAARGNAGGTGGAAGSSAGLSGSGTATATPIPASPASPAAATAKPSASTPASDPGSTPKNSGSPENKPPPGSKDGSGKGGGGFAGSAAAGLIGAAVALGGAWGWQATRGDHVGTAALTERIKANETVLASLKANPAPDMKLVETRIAALEAATQSQTASGATLRPAIDKIAGTVAANSGQIAKFETRIAALEKLATAAKTSIRATGDPLAKKPESGSQEKSQDKSQEKNTDSTGKSATTPAEAGRPPQTVSGQPKQVQSETQKPASGESGKPPTTAAGASAQKDGKPDTPPDRPDTPADRNGAVAEKTVNGPAGKTGIASQPVTGNKTAGAEPVKPPVVQELPPGIATLPPRFARLETRLQDLEKKIKPPADLGPVNEQIAALAKKLEPLEQQVSGKMDLKIAPVAAALAKSAGIIASNTKAIAETGEKASASLERSSAAANAIVARTLLERISEGKPFDGLVTALKAMGANAGHIAALQPVAEKGVASKSALIASFTALESRILEPDAPKADAPMIERLKSSAFSLVKVRPAGQTASTTPGGLYTRILAALGNEQWTQALDLHAKLPEKARAATAEWAVMVKSRITAQTAAGSILSDTLKQLQQQKS